MKIIEAEFVKSASVLKEAPDWELPEITLVGRSNVGKSSLINTLCNRKNLAKTSNTPGKTRLMNFYRIRTDEEATAFAMVDLPGYGYAKVSKTEQQRWQQHLEQYLTQRKNLVKVIQLIDARLGPQESDLQMMTYLTYHRLPTTAVLTKIDKISKNDWAKQLAKNPGMLPFSAQTGFGKDAVVSCLKSSLTEVLHE